MENDNLNDFCGKRMSFKQLIDNYKIIIPVIQRDYAQGRKDEHATEVRVGFVEKLISYIFDKNKESHDLYFIYGTSDNGKEFIPLDGQQRLTTLFLLHLYVAGMHKPDNVKNLLEDKFAYKTRDSSTMFCKDIVEYSQEVFCTFINGLKKGNKETLSKVITDQGWFFESWLQDPTVAGMLVMLDEISKQFLKKSQGPEGIEETVEEAYKRLFEAGDAENHPITFQILPLKGYTRTDDLYIKLNARGIHLSDFDNFKARLEDFISYSEIKFDNDFDICKAMDVDWNEYLWKDRGAADSTDAIIENLFRNFIAFSYRNDTLKESELQKRMEYLLEQNKRTMRFTFSSYCEQGVFHKRSEEIDLKRKQEESVMMQQVVDFFNILCNDKTDPTKYSSNWFKPDSILEKHRIKSDSTFSQRLRLYAYLKYFRTHNNATTQDDDLNEWMRLVRNLDEATDIDDAGKFYQAIRSVDDMLENKIKNQHIVDWLASFKDSIKFFRQREMKEECIKAQLRKQESKFKICGIKKVIDECDNNDYMNGQMGFILEFAGAYDLYDKTSICTMDIQDLTNLAESIKYYSDKSIELFEKLKNPSDPVQNEQLVVRALLTLGDYLRPNSSNRLNFCNQYSDPYNSWKTMLFVEEENRICRDCFKSLLNELRVADKESLERGLRYIINNKTSTIPEWRKYLIECPELISYCKQGFIWHNDNYSHIILLRQSQMNHYHSELFSRYIYVYEKKKGQTGICYTEVRKTDEEASVGLKFKDTNTNKEYVFHLTCENGNWKYWIEASENQEHVDSQFHNLFNGVDSNKDGKDILEQAISAINNTDQQFEIVS